MKKIIEKLGLSEYVIIVSFGIILLISHLRGFTFSESIGKNFWMFFSEMITFLPLMFILIGLADVWIPKEKVEMHIGPGSGIRGTFWVILLGTLQAGPLYGAFPVAYILWNKGCSVRNIFIYLGAFSTMKLPMFAFEIGFLGLKFSILRTLITMPVFIVIGFIMDLVLRGTNFSILPVNKDES